MLNSSGLLGKTLPLKNDPMNVLSSYLSPFGTTIEEAWLHHIARMTVMDYSMGDLYEEYLGYYSRYPESEDRYAETVMQEGSMGWRNAPSGTKPQRFGHNTIIARGLTESAMTFAIRGDDTGSEGSPATFGATVTKVRNGNITYHPLGFDGNEGEVTLTGIRSGDTHYLSIGVWSDAWDPDGFIQKPMIMNTTLVLQTESFQSLLVNHPESHLMNPALQVMGMVVSLAPDSETMS